MERLKNMELKKTFLVLSASCVLGALLMLGLVFMICNSISSNFPSGGIEILADGSIVKMEPPTETQQNIFSMLGIIQIVSCIVLPMGGLALSGILYYHIKLKQPISTLRNGISRIRNHDLDFSMSAVSLSEQHRPMLYSLSLFRLWRLWKLRLFLLWPACLQRQFLCVLLQE